MISGVLTSLASVSLVAALIYAASWIARWSYRRFARTAHGPASKALVLVGPDTPLDAMLDPPEQEHQRQSGIMLLLDNVDAYAARAQSVAMAGRSLDLMYYIWRTDIAGWLLIDALVMAADRGVRVRLLLDDVNVQGFDRTFLALTQHPMIEVRLFNPTRNRGQAFRRMTEMVMGLERFNRRMHGKLWIVDGRLAIIGGRNIGDTYFNANESIRNAVDADIMLQGQKVSDVSEVFDSYWNLGLSLPIAALWPKFRVNSVAFRKRLARHVHSARSREFAVKAQVGRSPDSFLTERLIWTDKVQLLADPPDKAYNLHTTPWMDTVISSVLEAAKTEVRLVTPYFVPGKVGIAWLTGLTKRGIKLSLVTNALSATDLIIVHGAYRYYRTPLLAAEGKLFEFSKPEKSGGKRDFLHSKVFLIDGRQGFIGSFNFDLRSAYTNTELGLLFEAPALSAELTAMFDSLCSPQQSYQVTRKDRSLQWAVDRLGLPKVMTVEPEATWPKRALSWLVGHLPIQKYL